MKEQNAVTNEQAREALDRILNFCEEIDNHIPPDETTGYKMLPDYFIVSRYLNEADYRKKEWISVEDELPQIAGKYLIARKTVYGNLINIVWYDTNYNGGNDDMIGKSVWYMFDGDWGDYEIPDVTHWMPLPEPPKMKGGAE